MNVDLSKIYVDILSLAHFSHAIVYEGFFRENKTAKISNVQECCKHHLSFRTPTLYNNSIIVKNGSPISCPIIMFTSNGKDIGDLWISKQKQFAKENNIELNSFDCGHYLHYYKSEEITGSIQKFINNNF